MHLDNVSADAEARLLGLIKRRGPQRTSELAAALAISSRARASN